MTKFKDYPSDNRRLWARLQALEPKPQPYDDSEMGWGLVFWPIVCALIWAVALLWYCWDRVEPVTKIFPAIYG